MFTKLSTQKLVSTSWLKNIDYVIYSYSYKQETHKEILVNKVHRQIQANFYETPITCLSFLGSIIAKRCFFNGNHILPIKNILRKNGPWAHESGMASSFHHIDSATSSKTTN